MGCISSEPAAKEGKLPPTELPPTGLPARVFISFRFGEALPQATMLKEALEARNVPCFVCAVAEGENIARTIALNLAKAELVIILATATYGRETPSSFGTYQEMQFVMEGPKPFFLVRMCERYEEPLTQLYFNSTISYYPWFGKELSRLPDDLVQRIVDKLNNKSPAPMPVVAIVKREWLSITRANGDKYEGECVNGAPDGVGKTLHSDGKTWHEGEYSKAEANGPGKEYRDSQLIFEGTYKDGKRWEGFGKEYMSRRQNGSVRHDIAYEGTYKEGKRDKGQTYEYFDFYYPTGVSSVGVRQAAIGGSRPAVTKKGFSVY